MSRNIKGNQKHLSLQDRIFIEKALDQREHFKDIAAQLHKDPSTISKEIRLRRIFKPSVESNHCAKKKACSRKDLCSRHRYCGTHCKSCEENCNLICPDFEPESCSKLYRAPLVCNGCDRKRYCRKDKYYYQAAPAHSSYRSQLSTAREGINMTAQQLQAMDSIVSSGVAKGQSIAHIYLANQDEIPCSSRTLYNYVEQNVLSIRNLDLPRKVKYKPRKKSSQPKRNPSWSEGRKYQDFLELEDIDDVVEMDTVEGKQEDKKVLHTLYLRATHLMLIRLLPYKTQLYVKEELDRLEYVLGFVTFRKIFSRILTDRGTEFNNPYLLEQSACGLYRTSIYYCDPQASWQKPGIEKNHEYIRYILPKGTSFESLKQEDAQLMMSHINSVPRKSLKGHNPFRLTAELYGKNMLDALGIKEIPANDVILTPSLLKR